jgi:hypothetical protein
MAWDSGERMDTRFLTAVWMMLYSPAAAKVATEAKEATINWSSIT